MELHGFCKNSSKITPHSTCGQAGQETNPRKTSVLHEVGTGLNNHVQNRKTHLHENLQPAWGEAQPPWWEKGGSFSRHTEGSVVNAGSQSQPLQRWLATLAM